MRPRNKAMLVGAGVGAFCATLWTVVSVFPLIQMMISSSGGLGAVTIDPVAIVIAGLVGFSLGYIVVMRRSRKAQTELRSQ
jgi:hypothetical protein